MSSLSLHVTSSVEHLPVDRICDVELALTLRNDGRGAIEIYPKAAKIDAIASYAGVGMTWSLALVPAGTDEPVPLLELRRYYGPPGNPPSPHYTKQSAVTLAPGEQHVEPLPACWIPNARLAPEHLAPATLDPQGMDNIGARTWTPPPGYSLPPPVAERFALAQASVLVFRASASAIEPAMQTPDFLRGHVVAFVSGSGAYELRAGYGQHSWQGLGTAIDVRATPIPFVVG